MAYYSERICPCEETNFFCFCFDCRNKLSNISLSENSSVQREEAVDKSLRQTEHILQCLYDNKNAAELEINLSVHKQHNYIEKIKNAHLNNLHRAFSIKAQILKKQIEGLRQSTSYNSLMQHNLLVGPHEDSKLNFSDQLTSVLFDKAPKLDYWHLTACAENTLVYGVSTKIALVNTPSYITIRCLDHLSKRRKTGGDQIDAVIDFPSGNRDKLEIKDYGNGDYTAMFMSSAIGEHIIRVTLRKLELLNLVQRPILILRRAYKDLKYSSMSSFQPSSLSLGWGVHCDREGSLFVTERKIHCVLVFGPDFQLSRKFGGPGNKDGELNRPTGITVDIHRRIIVVDKNNHRIQIFSIDGDFILSFGRRGIANGEFQYPWDVDSNSKGQIIVSDSHNHRVQLFDENGTYLLSYRSARDNYGKFHDKLDHPRGVCFDHQGNVLVVDFNLHYVLALTPELKYLGGFGKKGNGKGEFFGPQGIFIDHEGYIFVVDTRNSRVQVFLPYGQFCSVIGPNEVPIDTSLILNTASNKEVPLKTSLVPSVTNQPFAPCDITMSPDGLLFMVQAPTPTTDIQSCIYVI